MKFLFSLGAMSVVAAGLLPLSATAQTSAVTDPVGYTSVATPSNSDTLVALTFTRPPSYVGVVASAANDPIPSGSTVPLTGTITLSGTPGFLAGQFVYNSGVQSNHYYVLTSQIGTTANPKEGRVYSVSNNGTGTLTVDLNGDDISAIPAGTQLRLIPYWTLGTAFPDSDLNTAYTATTSTRLLKTQIIIPDYTSVGTNLAFSKTYYYISNTVAGAANTGWRLFGDASTASHADDIFIPDGYVVIRQDNSAPAGKLTSVGSVLTKKITLPLATSNTQYQDNSVALPRPVDISLDNLGLNTVDGSLVPTTSTRTLLDQLLVYDNASILLNKSPSKTYFYVNNVVNGAANVGWRLFGDGQTNPHGSDTIPAGSAVILRKAPTSAGQTVFWTNTPTY